MERQKQIQDQAYSYGVMGNIFSALEWYAKRSSNKNQYKIIPFNIDDTSYITAKNLINKTALSSSDISTFKSILKELRFMDESIDN